MSQHHMAAIPPQAGQQDGCQELRRAGPFQ
jgi:hypothetical protein